jgi:hypothetical protein
MCSACLLAIFCVTLLFMCPVEAAVVPCASVVLIGADYSHDPNISFSRCNQSVQLFSVMDLTNATLYLSFNAKANNTLNFSSLSISLPGMNSANVNVFVTSWPVDSELRVSGVWVNLTIRVVGSPIRQGIAARNATLQNCLFSMTEYNNVITFTQSNIRLFHVVFTAGVNVTWILNNVTVNVTSSEQSSIMAANTTTCDSCVVMLTNIVGTHIGAAAGLAPLFSGCNLSRTTILVANMSLTAVELSDPRLAAFTQANFFSMLLSALTDVNISIVNVTARIAGPICAFNGTTATRMSMSIATSSFISQTSRVAGASTLLIRASRFHDSQVSVADTIMNGTTASWVAGSIYLLNSAFTSSSLLFRRCFIAAHNIANAPTVASIFIVETNFSLRSRIAVSDSTLHAFNASDMSLMSNKFTAGIGVSGGRWSSGSTFLVLNTNISAVALHNVYDTVTLVSNVFSILVFDSHVTEESALSLANVQLSSFGGLLISRSNFTSRASVSMSDSTISGQSTGLVLANSSVTNSLISVERSVCTTAAGVGNVVAFGAQFVTFRDSSFFLNRTTLLTTKHLELKPALFYLACGCAFRESPLLTSTLVVTAANWSIGGAQTVSAVAFFGRGELLSASTVAISASLCRTESTSRAMAVVFMGDVRDSTIHIEETRLLAQVQHDAFDNSIGACVVITKDSSLTSSVSIPAVWNTSTFAVWNSVLNSPSTQLTNKFTGAVTYSLACSIAINESSWTKVRFLLQNTTANAGNSNFFHVVGSVFALINSTIELNRATLNATGSGIAVNVAFSGATFNDSCFIIIRNSSTLLADATYTMSVIVSLLPFNTAASIVLMGSIAKEELPVTMSLTICMLSSVLNATMRGPLPNEGSSALSGTVVLSHAMNLSISIEQSRIALIGLGVGACVLVNGSSRGASFTIHGGSILVNMSQSGVMLGAVVLFFTSSGDDAVVSLTDGTYTVLLVAAPQTKTQQGCIVASYNSSLRGLQLRAHNTTANVTATSLSSDPSALTFVLVLGSLIHRSTILLDSLRHTSNIGRTSGFSSLLSFAQSQIRRCQISVLRSTVSCLGVATFDQSTGKIPLVMAIAFVFVSANISEETAIVVNGSSVLSYSLGSAFLCLLQSGLGTGSSFLVGSSTTALSKGEGRIKLSPLFSVTVEISLISASILIVQSVIANASIVIDSSSIKCQSSAFIAANMKIVLSTVLSSTLLFQNASVVAEMQEGIYPTLSTYAAFIPVDLTALLLAEYNNIGGPYSGNIIVEASTFGDGSSLQARSGTVFECASQKGLEKFVFANIAFINGTTIGRGAVVDLRSSNAGQLGKSLRVPEASVMLQDCAIPGGAAVLLSDFRMLGASEAIGLRRCTNVSSMNISVGFGGLRSPFNFSSGPLLRIWSCGDIRGVTISLAACLAPKAPILSISASSLSSCTVTGRGIATSADGSFLVSTSDVSFINTSLLLTDVISVAATAPIVAFKAWNSSLLVVENSSFQSAASSPPLLSFATMDESSIVSVTLSNCSFRGFRQLFSRAPVPVSSLDNQSRVAVFCSLWNGRRLTLQRLGPSGRQFIDVVMPHYLNRPFEVCEVSQTGSLTVNVSASGSVSPATRTSSLSASPTSSPSAAHTGSPSLEPTHSPTSSPSTSSTVSNSLQLTRTPTPRPTPSSTVSGTLELTRTPTPPPTPSGTISAKFSTTETATLIPPTPTLSDYIQGIPCPEVSVSSTVALTDQVFSQQLVVIQLGLPGLFRWSSSPWKYQGMPLIEFFVSEAPLPQPFGFKTVLAPRFREFNYSFAFKNGSRLFSIVEVVFPVAPAYSLIVSETVNIRIDTRAIQNRCGGKENVDASAAYGTFAVTPSRTTALVALVSALGIAGGAASIFNAGSADAQILALIGLSPCATAASRSAASSMQFLLSPFYQYGLGAMIVGNVLVVCVMIVVERLIAECILVPRYESDAAIAAKGVPPLYQAWAAVRFPSSAYLVAMFLHQGTTAAIFTAFGSSAIANVITALGGLMFVGAFYLSMRTVRRLERAAPYKVRGKFIPYVLPYGPYRRVFYPTGQWTSDAFRKCFGRILGGMTPEYVWWSLYPSIMVIFFNLINAISFEPSQCHIQSLLLALVSSVMCGLLVWKRPFRIPFTTAFAAGILACTSLLLVLTAANSYSSSNNLVLMTLYVSCLQTLLSSLRLCHQVYIVFWERRWNKVVDAQREAESSLASMCIPDEHLGEIMELRAPRAAACPVLLAPLQNDNESSGAPKRSKWLIAAELRICQEAILQRAMVVGVLQHRPTAGADMLYRLEAVLLLAVEHQRRLKLLAELDAD